MKIAKEVSIGRGRRIRMMRSFTGLARSDFQKKFNIATSTLETWESGKVALTIKGAERIVSALAKEGIDCTVDWLINGISNYPVIPGEKNIHLPLVYGMMAESDPEICIMQEAECFIRINCNAVVSMIHDDAMEPFYKCGDYVGGFKVDVNDLDTLIGSEVILQTSKYVNLVRRLEKGNAAETYALSCINKSNCCNAENIYVNKSDIEEIAEIVWHRRNPVYRMRNKVAA